MKRDRWPVILEDSFRENVTNGWSVLVLCVESPKRVGSSWTGHWRFFCVSPEGEERLVLVLRKNIEPRKFASTHGVTSFLAELGISVSMAPMVEGQYIEISRDLSKITVGHESL